MRTSEEIQGELLFMQDTAYRDFQGRLMPAVPRERVIGIRVPVLRRYAKALAREPDSRAAFLAVLPHVYHEENMLHAFLLEQETELDRLIGELDRFLPFVDDWSTCDSMNPPLLGRERSALLPHIWRWLACGEPFAVRYAIGLLMRYFLDGTPDPALMQAVAAVEQDAYYVSTMVAWYFATALVKQPQAALPYFAVGRLPEQTRKRAIRKALESLRVTPEQKAFLKTLS